MIEIVEYRDTWPALFGELGFRLRAGLGDVALRIDHIGSTAVPGLRAKPVIDVQVSVEAFEPAAFRAPLEAMGFEFRAGDPDRTKRYFRETSGPRTHVHVRRAGSFAEQFCLLLRDYLRDSPADAELYGARKALLAERYGMDRRAYTAAKSSVVWELVHRADVWAQARGWQPGRSDA
ncbi:GrpB family protein [Streptomyces rectiverticillatus]|uniref:GrpB family protein n=1 Tax=Streptomyces rectiverticillatus TaxID=173860 RepID=UPI001C4BD024|nr:GrpB family protein [Streptomyces rectiverticillatus]